MAFDKETRGKLAKAVTECRLILEEELSGQLQTMFGIQPKGDAAPLV